MVIIIITSHDLYNDMNNTRYPDGFYAIQNLIAINTDSVAEYQSLLENQLSALKRTDTSEQQRITKEIVELENLQTKHDQRIASKLPQSDQEPFYHYKDNIDAVIDSHKKLEENIHLTKTALREKYSDTIKSHKTLLCIASPTYKEIINDNKKELISNCGTFLIQEYYDLMQEYKNLEQSRLTILLKKKDVLLEKKKEHITKKEYIDINEQLTQIDTEEPLIKDQINNYEIILKNISSTLLDGLGKISFAVPDIDNAICTYNSRTYDCSKKEDLVCLNRLASLYISRSECNKDYTLFKKYPDLAEENLKFVENYISTLDSQIHNIDTTINKVKRRADASGNLDSSNSALLSKLENVKYNLSTARHTVLEECTLIKESASKASVEGSESKEDLLHSANVKQEEQEITNDTVPQEKSISDSKENQRDSGDIDNGNQYSKKLQILYDKVYNTKIHIRTLSEKHQEIKNYKQSLYNQSVLINSNIMQKQINEYSKKEINNFAELNKAHNKLQKYTDKIKLLESTELHSNSKELAKIDLKIERYERRITGCDSKIKNLNEKIQKYKNWNTALEQRIVTNLNPILKNNPQDKEVISERESSQAIYKNNFLLINQYTKHLAKEQIYKKETNNKLQDLKTKRIKTIIKQVHKKTDGTLLFKLLKKIMEINLLKIKSIKKIKDFYKDKAIKEIQDLESEISNLMNQNDIPVSNLLEELDNKIYALYKSTGYEHKVTDAQLLELLIPMRDKKFANDNKVNINKKMDSELMQKLIRSEEIMFAELFQEKETYNSVIQKKENLILETMNKKVQSLENNPNISTEQKTQKIAEITSKAKKEVDAIQKKELNNLYKKTYKINKKNDFLKYNKDFSGRFNKLFFFKNKKEKDNYMLDCTKNILQLYTTKLEQLTKRKESLLKKLNNDVHTENQKASIDNEINTISHLTEFWLNPKIHSLQETLQNKKSSPDTFKNVSIESDVINSLQQVDHHEKLDASLAISTDSSKDLGTQATSLEVSKKNVSIESDVINSLQQVDHHEEFDASLAISTDSSKDLGTQATSLEVSQKNLSIDSDVINFLQQVDHHEELDGNLMVAPDSNIPDSLPKDKQYDANTGQQL